MGRRDAARDQGGIRRAPTAVPGERWRLAVQRAPEVRAGVSDEERRDAYETRWKLGGVLFAKTFPDQTKTEAANATARDFAEEKIRLLVDDPAVADKLIPNDHPIGTKRIVTDTHYFETYNRPNVTLVDLKAAPIESITPSGITTADADYALDTLVFATGFDAMTGASTACGSSGATVCRCPSTGVRDRKPISVWVFRGSRTCSS